MISALYIPRGRAPQLGVRPRPLAVLSLAVGGGGLCSARDIVNMHVDKDYDGGRPEDDLAACAITCGIDGVFVGLMTAASAGEPQVRRRSQASVSRTSSIQPAPAMASGKPQVVIASRAT
ncbi:MAG: adenosylcobinamide amidohydrolase [Actinobacteria bacterium]|nr:adenosylcobinamide amidohydrolase [Actinomycetota bacterium]